MSTLIGDEIVISRLNARGLLYERQILQAVTRLTIDLQRSVRSEKLSGQVLNVVTGTLRRSIDYRVTQQTKGIEGRVSTNIFYGAVHEYGPRATAEASRAAFRREEGRTQIEQLPPRSFLRSALQDLIASGRIERDLSAAVSL